MMAQQYEVEMLGSQSQVTTLGEQTIENTFNNINPLTPMGVPH